MALGDSRRRNGIETTMRISVMQFICVVVVDAVPVVCLRLLEEIEHRFHKHIRTWYTPIYGALFCVCVHTRRLVSFSPVENASAAVRDRERARGRESCRKSDAQRAWVSHKTAKRKAVNRRDCVLWVKWGALALPQVHFPVGFVRIHSGERLICR